MVPPLRGRRAADGAEEKAGHFGRDDSVRKGEPKRAGQAPPLQKRERAGPPEGGRYAGACWGTRGRDRLRGFMEAIRKETETSVASRDPRGGRAGFWALIGT